jgi:hypothetical protein
MRRGPFGALVFGLALLMQLVAPALAWQASAVGTAGHAPICVSDGSSDDADGSSSGSLPPHHEHCGLCQFVCGATGLLGVLSASISLPHTIEFGVAAWTSEPEHEARFGSDQHEVPRGPPLLA